MAELTRRDLVKSTGAAAAAVAAYSLRGPASAVFASPARATTIAAWNHDPGSSSGPNHWGDIGYPTCAQGMNQSPINIDRSHVTIDHGPPLLLRYQVSELGIENTGHVVEVPIPTDIHDTLQIGGDTYELVQYHFHAPSEHEVNGRRADVEAHFVHQNADGATAVVGVFYVVGRHSNPLLDKVLLNAPEAAGDELHAGEASPAELLHGLERVSAGRGRVRVDSFFAYQGSLTTPGCTENVRWSVLAHGGRVSGAAVTRFHEVISKFPGYGGYPNNNRPVQPLNGRVVELRQRNRRQH